MVDPVPSKATVPVASGRVIVLAADCVSTVRVVSKAFRAGPSNIMFTGVKFASSAVFLPRYRSPPEI